MADKSNEISDDWVGSPGRVADLARLQRFAEVGGLDIDVSGGLTSWRSPEYLK